MPLVEICVESAVEAKVAVAGGADRIELCQELSCGGLTPNFHEIEAALETKPSHGLQILVRNTPRGFDLEQHEVEKICNQIRQIRSIFYSKELPLGFVVGATQRTKKGRSINYSAAEAFREAADSAPLTFHRAFDTIDDQSAALLRLAEIGYDRILTTGGDKSVAQSAKLRELIAKGEQLRNSMPTIPSSPIILISGGIRSENVRKLLIETGAKEVHMRAPAKNSQGTSQKEVEKIMHQVQMIPN